MYRILRESSHSHRALENEPHPGFEMKHGVRLEKPRGGVTEVRRRASMLLPLHGVEAVVVVGGVLPLADELT